MSAKQGRPTSNGYETATDIFLKEHLFNDITSRANISVRDRELATVSMLAALGNVNPQLAAHIGGAKKDSYFSYVTFEPAGDEEYGALGK